MNLRSAVYLLLMFCYFIGVSQDAKMEQLLKGKDLAQSLNIIDSFRIQALKTDPNASLPYYERIIKLGKENNSDSVIAKAFWLKSKYYRKRGEFDQSEIALTKAKDLFKKYNKAEWEITVLADLGTIYMMRGIYEGALNNYMGAIKIAEKANYKKQLGNIYANMGSIYLSREDYDRATEFYKKAYNDFEEKKDSVNCALTLDNLGLVHGKKKKYDLALEYHFEALKTIEKIKDKSFLGESYINISINYIGLKDYIKAKEFLLKAEEICSAMNSKIGLTTVYINLGEINLKQHNYTEALPIFLKGYEIAKEIGSYDHLKTYTENISQTYEGLKQYDKALEFHKEYTRVKDTVLNIENSQQINELTERFESKQKQIEIDLLTKDKLINETTIRQNKFVTLALVLGILFTFILLSAFYFRYRDKKKANLLLEEKNKIIEEKQKEIFDSLQYAKQIQKLLLANHKLVNETLPNSFVMFKPKDIVSGDFYWAAKKEDRFYLAVCDSTGHGVPGAFMSLLNINFLDEAVNDKNIAEPNEIFNYVRTRLVTNISQDGRQDGMDGILICVKDHSNKITYAAANNAPVIIRNNELSVLDADKMPVGKGEKTEPFKLYSFDVQNGDQLYLYTDGFADQFGGPKGKKYKYKPMNEFILKNNALSVLEQEEKLFSEFDRWKGSLEQVDDVCILGIRF